MKKKSTEPTLLDVATHSGVSIATVSRVLNDRSKVSPATAERVQAAIDELGYAAGSAAARSRLIAVVLPNLDNPFYAKIIKGIQVSAKGYGLEAVIVPEDNVDANWRRLAALLGAMNAGGLIVLSPINEAVTLDGLQKAAPMVQCAEYNDQHTVSYVGVDDYAAAKSAVETLLQRGRRRIALINGPIKYKYARQRALGYEAALKQAGVALDPTLVFHVTERGFDTSLAVARQLILSRERPDAILATSDMIASAVIKVACQEGVAVPQELSVIGFDNTFVSIVSHPSVTAVNMPQFQLGYMACEVLAERMQNPSAEPKQVLLKTELVLRDSI